LSVMSEAFPVGYIGQGLDTGVTGLDATYGI